VGVSVGEGDNKNDVCSIVSGMLARPNINSTIQLPSISSQLTMGHKT